MCHTENLNDISKFKEYFDIIFPVTAFILGILADRIIDIFVERKRVSKAGERWIAEIEFYNTPLDNQIEELKKFLIEHRKEKFDTPEVTTIIQLRGDIFKSLDKGDLYKYLLQKFKKREKAIEIGNKINGAVLINEQLAINLENKFYSYQDTCSKHVDYFKLHLQKAMKSFVKLETEVEKINNDPLLGPIDLLFRKYIFPHLAYTGTTDENKTPMELFEIQSEFLIPTIEHLSKFIGDERIEIFSTHISECQQAIIEIRLEKSYLEINIENFIEGFIRVKESLSECLNEIKK
ncbi:MAG: hypothetical protein KDD29_03335 [Flavobacteriales bacterium]|nr:hypothetical protein [Flavobacteriales bacterium]MCB9335207.1 hypothetical protein [Flavobacteriales bacterium]